MNDLQPIQIGQHSQKGRKKINQDANGYFIPSEPFLTTKGIAVGLADGISSSTVSQEASEAVITGFKDDYYSTSEAWSVKNSGQCVLNALNSWLFAQTKRSDFRYNIEKGYVCTFSGLIIKGPNAHIFHIGDSRIIRLRGANFETLTQEHRKIISSQESYLSRAVGMDSTVNIDYLMVEMVLNDIFILMTDGVYEYVTEAEILSTLKNSSLDLNAVAENLTRLAYQNGSDDNLTVQLVKINQLNEKVTADLYQELASLPFPPELEARMEFDGYIIERELASSARSHVFLATDLETDEKVVIKTLSTDLREDKSARERFLLEEWIARRVTSTHLLKPCKITRTRCYFYIVTEYVQGQTLAQWMIDNPTPSVEMVRNIVEQIAKGLMALHRMEMLHQDLRPENIMIEHTGTVKIIDFGAVLVAGVEDMFLDSFYEDILGTAQYSAPEYFLGEHGSPSSDLFSLAVITYQMLSGQLPYGPAIARAQTRSAQKRLKYRSVLNDDLVIPAWLDFALKKALHPDPLKRYEQLSEFIYDLRQPNKAFLSQTKPPIIERNPVAFWQVTTILLGLVVLALLYWR